MRLRSHSRAALCIKLSSEPNRSDEDILKGAIVAESYLSAATCGSGIRFGVRV